MVNVAEGVCGTARKEPDVFSRKAMDLAKLNQSLGTGNAFKESELLGKGSQLRPEVTIDTHPERRRLGLRFIQRF